MGVFQQPLGMNVTDSNPLLKSPFVNEATTSSGGLPPGSDYMITETGIYMISESTSDFMITE